MNANTVRDVVGTYFFLNKYYFKILFLIYIALVLILKHPFDNHESDLPNAIYLKALT